MSFDPFETKNTKAFIFPGDDRQKVALAISISLDIIWYVSRLEILLKSGPKLQCVLSVKIDIQISTKDIGLWMRGLRIAIILLYFFQIEIASVA